MRSDPSQDNVFATSRGWDNVNWRNAVLVPRDEDDPRKGFVANSFSGNERNRLFLQNDKNFDDVSLVSGADFREDGRGFALLDFDRDGWLDIAIISPQEPRFRLMRNRIGDFPSASTNHSAFVSLVGGSDIAEAQAEWSSRDAYGATFVVTIGTRRQIYQNTCSLGLSSQNSKWMHVGMGKNEKIDRIEVSWPSGKKSIRENILAGERVVIREKTADDQNR